MEGRHRWFVIAVATLLAMCFVVPRADAVAWQSGPPDGTRWQSGQVRVVAFVAADAGRAIRGAIADWNRSDVVHIELAKTTPVSNVVNPCNVVTGAIVVCVTKGATSDKALAGWTQTYKNGNGYTSAAVVWLSLGLVRKSSRAVRRSLACHEIGHAIGLVHRDGNSCMNADSWPVHPDAYDYATLDAIYAGTYGP